MAKNLLRHGFANQLINGEGSLFTRLLDEAVTSTNGLAIELDIGHMTIHRGFAVGLTRRKPKDTLH